jgi:hypothetical protein
MSFKRPKRTLLLGLSARYTGPMLDQAHAARSPWLHLTRLAGPGAEAASRRRNSQAERKR